MTLEELKALEAIATEGPWAPEEKFSEEWQERYWGITTTDLRPIGTFDGDNAVWLAAGAATANRDLAIALRNVAPEILALVGAVREDILDENGEPCGCDRPVCATWRAFNAKLESL